MAGEMQMLVFGARFQTSKDPRAALTAEGVTDCKGVDMNYFSISQSDLERFESKFVRVSESQCWPWTGRLDNGYGRFWLNNRTALAHRIAYLIVNGTIPKSLHLDHLCRNRACVNPKHLEPVDIKTNVLRGFGLSAENARKTHCKNGHPLNEDNLYKMSRKTRVCRICQNNRLKKWRGINAD